MDKVLNKSNSLEQLSDEEFGVLINKMIVKQRKVISQSLNLYYKKHPDELDNITNEIQSIIQSRPNLSVNRPVTAWLYPNKKCIVKYKLTDEIQANIFLHPHGTVHSQKDWCACYIQLIGTRLDDDNQIKVVLKTNGITNNIKSQTYSMKQFAQFTDKWWGFNNLFPVNELKKSEYVKVTFSLITNKNNHTESNNKADNKQEPPPPPQTESKTICYKKRSINNNNSKFKRQKLLIQSKINFSDKKQKQLVNPKSTKRDYSHQKFPNNLMIKAISQISTQLNKDNLFGLIPNIDCFATKQNKQQQCREYITEEMNFFASKYDEKKFWLKKVAWCNPPQKRSIIVKTVQAFNTRKMRGYIRVICWPYNDQQKWRYKEQSWIFKLQNKHCTQWTMVKEHSKFNTIIMYFDYS